MPAPSPAIAHHRARVGALSRDRRPDDPEFLGAKCDLAEAKIAAYIDKILAATPLSAAQRSRLAEQLTRR
jgi:hypothetical protein